MSVSIESIVFLAVRARNNIAALAALVLAACVGLTPAHSADKKYGPGVTDTEIKIGQSAGYSGPASAYGNIAKAEIAYLKAINERGGVNGRKINLLSLDDGFSPPRTFEQTRKLVEQEGVLAIFSTTGTPTNAVIRKYLNDRKVPQLFAATGLSTFGDPKNFPWTIGFIPPYWIEGKIWAQYILDNVKDPKIAILYQNDDYGKDVMGGFREVMGDRAKTLIAAEATNELTDATVDSQITTLQASGANVFVNITTPKFAAQAIRKVSDIDWKALHILASPAASIGATLKPAGLDKAVGIISAQWLKDPTDSTLKDDKGVQEYFAFMNKHMPEADTKDILFAYGYTFAGALVQVLEQCGNDLTRENVMRQATNLKDVQLPLLFTKVNTSPTNYFPLSEMRLVKFDGQQWGALK